MEWKLKSENLLERCEKGSLFKVAKLMSSVLVQIKASGLAETKGLSNAT